MDYLAEGFKTAFIIHFSGHEEGSNVISTRVKASTFSILITLTVGIPLGFILGYYSFRGKHAC
jgi:tungstate transport system permease protein